MTPPHVQQQHTARFSVVVPLYNKGRYVQAALESALAQRHAALEVIVVDDGSTDDGPERVAANPDTRVRLVRQSNKGVSAARNRGIREATGDHVAFLDADDCWSPDYLSTIASMIGQFPECGMYATHWYGFTDTGYSHVQKLPIACASGAPLRIDRFFDAWSRAELFYTSSVVIPIRILRALAPAFPEGEQRGEDQDLWFRLAERWPLAYLANPLVGYRRDVPHSLMISYPVEELPYIRRLRSRYRSNAIPKSHKQGVRRVLGVDRISVARSLLLKGRRIAAFSKLRDPLCLLAPRYWSRVLLAACLPATLQRRLVGRTVDQFHH